MGQLKLSSLLRKIKGIKKMNTATDDMIIYLEKILELRIGYRSGTGYYFNIKNSIAF